MLTTVVPLSEAGNNPLLPHTAEIIFGFVFLILLAIAFAKIVVRGSKRLTPIGPRRSKAG